MKNEKLLFVSKGYQVIESKKNDCVLLRSPEGANLTIPLFICKDILNYFNSLNDRYV